jgi:agmatine deiminase
MPAETHPQDAIWLAWPHREEIWYGNHEAVLSCFVALIRELAVTERVRLLVATPDVERDAAERLGRAEAQRPHIEFVRIPTNDFWMRDNGPIFLIDGRGGKALVDWGFNGWGGKFGPCDLDDVVPLRIAERGGWRCFQPGLVLEGGAVEVDGEGTVLTTEQCLLNPNRNGEKTREDWEPLLCDYFGAAKVLWLPRGLSSDHTDGHIDNLARFAGPARVLASATEDSSHPDFEACRENLAILKASRDAKGRTLEVVELPLPEPTRIAGEDVSPSYANYIVGNRVVAAPIYGLATDQAALEILAAAFPDRRVVGLRADDILSGGGSLHCISQQEPTA